MERRSFIKGMSALAILGGCRTAAGDAEYSVTVLGDTHFDGPDSAGYHLGWKPRDEHDLQGRKSEFRRNAEMWRNRLPRLIEAAAAVRADDARAVFHVGDLIQGDTATPEMQLRMLRDAERACRKGMEDLPFYLACGNHDLRNGGAAGLDRYLPRADYMVSLGPDAYLFVDFMRPNPGRLEQMLKESAGARHTFVVSHGLLAPHDGWGYYWFLFGKKADTEIRRHFRHEFAKRNVIALGGHIHRTALMDWRLPEGRITQFAANSVWVDPAQGAGKTLYAGPEQYGTYERAHPTPMGQEHDGCHQNRTFEEAMALFDEYRKGLVRYRMVAAAGHYRLRVGEKVAVDFFPGDARKPSETFVLR